MAATPGVALDPINGKRGALSQAAISDCITHGLLVANTAKAVTVPAGSQWALVVSALDIYANAAATAVVPSGDLTGSVLTPVLGHSGRALNVAGATTLSLISASAGVFSVEFLQ